MIEKEMKRKPIQLFEVDDKVLVALADDGTMWVLDQIADSREKPCWMEIDNLPQPEKEEPKIEPATIVYDLEKLQKLAQKVCAFTGVKVTLGSITALRNELELQKVFTDKD